jgi:hypothetical protein
MTPSSDDSSSMKYPFQARNNNSDRNKINIRIKSLKEKGNNRLPLSLKKKISDMSLKQGASVTPKKMIQLFKKEMEME